MTVLGQLSGASFGGFLMSLDMSRAEDGLFKYVCFDDGSVLFGSAIDWNSSHKQLVDEKPRAAAVSAGTIKILGGRWCVEEGGSMTAKLCRRNNDEEMISAALAMCHLKHDPLLWHGSSPDFSWIAAIIG